MRCLQHCSVVLVIHYWQPDQIVSSGQDRMLKVNSGHRHDNKNDVLSHCGVFQITSFYHTVLY